VPFTATAVDEPPHDVILKDGQFELRQYQPLLVAEVVSAGNMRKAGNKGFRSLADFIFGNNRPAENIAMTAPVSRTKTNTEKIKMTAPVTRVENKDNSWTVTFVMPSKWRKDNLPQPNNPDISIREVAAELVASIRFSGRGSESRHNKKQDLLQQWITEQGYVAVGEARYAGYDAPWVPWPMRRNEVMIPVVKRNDDDLL